MSKRLDDVGALAADAWYWSWRLFCTVITLLAVSYASNACLIALRGPEPPRTHRHVRVAHVHARELR